MTYSTSYQKFSKDPRQCLSKMLSPKIDTPRINHNRFSLRKSGNVGATYLQYVEQLLNLEPVLFVKDKPFFQEQGGCCPHPLKTDPSGMDSGRIRVLLWISIRVFLRRGCLPLETRFLSSCLSLLCLSFMSCCEPSALFVISHNSLYQSIHGCAPHWWKSIRPRIPLFRS